MTASVVTKMMRQVVEHAVMRISWCIDSELSVAVDPGVMVSSTSVSKMLLLVPATKLQRQHACKGNHNVAFYFHPISYRSSSLYSSSDPLLFHSKLKTPLPKILPTINGLYPHQTDSLLCTVFRFCVLNSKLFFILNLLLWILIRVQ